MSSAKTGAAPHETSSAEVLLRALKAHGMDYFFANPGTDFAPIVEAFARSRKQGAAVPEPMVIPHENAAVSMAHGVYMVTGRPQAVMVHTTVGTGNTLNTLINASRDTSRCCCWRGARRSPKAKRMAGAADTFIGRRRCSTRRVWCARS